VHRLVRVLLICAFCLGMDSVASGIGAAQPRFSDKQLMDGFMRTVFGLEYRTWNWQPYRVKKYTRTVRFHIVNMARRDRTAAARRFIGSLNGAIRGLTTTIVSRQRDANFTIFVVDRPQYTEVVRREIYDDPKADAPGRCLVRVLSDSRGISSSTAVIVSDEGEFLFRRCLVEETLQGLGPMNDDRTLSYSVFNDQSRHDRFTTFDRFILNMLYHHRIRPGMSRNEAQSALPSVLRDVRRYVR